MHILIAILIFIGYGINKLFDEAVGKAIDNCNKKKNEFVDPHIYKDRYGFTRDKETDQIVFVERKNGRLCTVNCTGKIIRDVTDLEREREKNGQTL